MKWVTRERPKTDRIACPWLIKKFIDPEAEFLYVPSRPGAGGCRAGRARTPTTHPGRNTRTATGSAPSRC